MNTKASIQLDIKDRLIYLNIQSDLEFELAGKDADLKFGGGGSVDMFQSQNEKINTCISTHKSTILERYEKDLAEIEKKQKEVAEKAYEVSKPNENKGDKGKSIDSMTKKQAEDEASALEQRIKGWKNAGKPLDKDPIKQARERIVKLRAHISKLSATTPGGGGKRNVTLRRPRRYE